MIKVLICLTFLATILTGIYMSSSEYEVGFRGRYGPGIDNGTKYFYDLPRNISAAEAMNWTVTDQLEEGFRCGLVLYCASDRLICCYYSNKTGRVAGMQIALPQDEVTNRTLSFEIQGFKQWAPSTETGDIIKYWVATLMFNSEEYLEKSIEEINDNYDETKFLQEDKVWASNFYGSLIPLSIYETDLLANNFTIQGCVQSMGVHLFFKMSPTTLCEADTLFLWIALMHKGKMVAMVFITPGRLAVKDGQRDWLERGNRSQVLTMMPNGPECALDIAEKKNLLSFHIYFVDKPWLISPPCN